MGRPRTAAKRRAGRRKAARKLARLRAEMVAQQDVQDAGGSDWVAPSRAAAEASDDWIIRLDSRLAGLRACGWHSLRRSEDKHEEFYRRAMLAAFRLMWHRGREVPGIWDWWINLHSQQREQLVRMTHKITQLEKELKKKPRKSQGLQG